MRVETQTVGDAVMPTAPTYGRIAPVPPLGPSTRELAEEIVRLLKRKPRR